MAAPDDLPNSTASDAAFATLVTTLAAQYSPASHSAQSAAETAERVCAKATGEVLPVALEESGWRVSSAPDRASHAVTSSPIVPLTFALKAAFACVTALVPAARIAAFVNDLGGAARDAGFVDVQLYIQQRRRKTADDVPEIWGLVLDIDEASDDPFGAFAAAGLPPPSCWWKTRNGFKGVWSFNRTADKSTFTTIAQQFAVSMPGADPGSWLVTQAQHLPVGRKETLDGVVDINLPATQTNGVPFALDAYEPSLPLRLERALSGARRLTESERLVVEEWLDERGIPAPEEPGRTIYDVCPDVLKHDSACCYVYRQPDGSIDITCLGGHSGEGRKFWSEVALCSAATGISLKGAAYDALDDIPYTWAGIEFVTNRFASALANEAHATALTAAAVLVWKRAKLARRLTLLRRKAKRIGAQLISVPSYDDLVYMCRRKLEGDRTGFVRLLYDDVRRELGHMLAAGGVLPTRAHSDSLSLKSHRHEWLATMAFDLDIEVTEVPSEGDGTENIATIELLPDDAFSSVFNKALGGDPSFLAVLGTPVVELHELPVAYLRDGWSIDPLSKALRFVRTAQMKSSNPDFEVLEFFRRLFLAGKLPLAGEDDIPRLVMLIAIPLLRLVAPGLLGVFWFIGPSGAGKDYLAMIVSAIWRHAVEASVKVSFDLNLTDDLEQKRCFAAAGPAIYARAKEAGKRFDMIDLLIRLAGTDEVTARGMRKDEVMLRNLYTYVADSVEDLPERREISRRTVVINVAHIDDSVSKGEVAQEIIDRAPDILASVKKLVESKPTEFYLNHANTGSRPVVPVALAHLLGAALPEVSGASFEELFMHVLHYVDSAMLHPPDEEKPKGRDKDGKETLLFPTFRLAHLIDVMKRLPGKEQFFKTYSTTRAIERLLQREIKDYTDVERRKKPYLRVEVDGKPYAFKLVAGKQNFLFVEETKFRTGMDLGPDEQGADASVPRSTTDDTASAVAPSDAAVPPSGQISLVDRPTSSTTTQKGPMRFSSSTLHSCGSAKEVSGAPKRK